MHEIAHFLDFNGLETQSSGTGTFSSKRMFLDDHPDFTEESLRELHLAIANSDSYERLLEYSKQKKLKTPKHDGGMTYTVDKKHATYLLSSEEVFARAYCQYVATRSGDETLRKQIAATLLPGTTSSIGGKDEHSLKYPEYWTPKDFEPIGEALDNLFKSQGWLA